MKRIDINACFGHWQYWDLHHKTPAQLVGVMDRVGIDQAAVLSLRGVFVDWRAGNDETLAAAAQHPGRLIPVVTLSPFMTLDTSQSLRDSASRGGHGRSGVSRVNGGGDELHRLCDAGARGVRLYPSFHSYRLDSAFVDEICRVAVERGIPVMIPTRIMMNWRFVPIAPDTIADVVSRHPHTEFVLSGQNYLAEYQALVKLMQHAPNTWYEFSCMQGFGALARLISEVGSARVLFGTGAVLNYAACNVAKLDGAQLSPADREAVAWQNAARLLGISV
jgi:hypothetical protein